MPEPRAGHVAARLQSGTVLIAGGYTTDNTVLPSAFIFNPATNSIAPTPNGMNLARASASATTLIDGRVVIVGGTDGANDLASAEIYDPSLQSFTTTSTQLSVAVRGHSAVLLPHNGSVLIAGGTSNGVARAGVDLFLPAEFPDPFSWGVGRFAPTAAMSAARSTGIAGPTAVEGYAFATGGGSNDVERYRFATIKTDKDDYAPGQHALITGTGWQPGEQVTLTFQEDPAVHDDYVLTVTADDQGNISTSEWAPEQHDLSVRFYLTASGSRSKAQTTFTDGNLFSTITFGIGPASVAPGGTLNWSVNAVCRTNGGNTCAEEGYTNGGAVQDGYTVIIQRATNAAFLGTVANVTAAIPTSGGGASGSFAAPLSGGPYFYRARHDNQNLSDLPVQGNSPNSWQPETSTVVQVTLIADSTPPVITPTVVGTLGNNDWYTSNVSVTWSVTDAESAITSTTGCGPSSVTLDTAGDTFTCSATSTGGTASQSVTIKRDAHAPNAPTGTKTPAANGAGWNNTDVTVSFVSAGDVGPSGVSSCSDPVSLTSETLVTGTNVTGTCTDEAGNLSDGTTINVKIDKTAPTGIVGTPARVPDHGSWYTAPVAITFNGTDTLSGIASCTSPTYGGPDGASVSVAGSCTDNAGNTASGSFSLNYDTAAPMISGSRTPGANAYGWNNTNVTVSFTCSDAASGLAAGSPPGSTELSSEGAGQSVTGTCVDNAGHSASATVSGINIDKTAPSISASRLPAPNANGWNNTDVTATYMASDALSGLVEAATGTHTFNTDGAGQEHPFEVHDKAGNSAMTVVSGVNIDKTAPIITPHRTPAANSNGWNNTDVTVSFECTDATSGLAAGSPPAPTTITAEVTGHSVSGTCIDVADNSASATVTGINIDKTNPLIVGSRLPLANANGWNNTDVTVHFVCSDARSGLAAGSPPADTPVSSEGANQSVIGTCTDLAGNSASFTVGNISIDKTAPTLAVTGVAEGATYTFGAVPAAGCSTSDLLSGVATNAVVSVSAGVPPGVGPITATCSGATDKAGNGASNVVVHYTVQFSGTNAVCNGTPGHQVLQPINLTGSSVFPKKGGSTVPVKFRVCGADGVSVGPTQVVQNFQLTQILNGIPGEINETDIEATNSDTAFRWSASDAQWIFNLSTKNLNAGRTYVYVITLTDLTTIEFRFALK
jgi:hypothetical protein